MAEEKDFPNTTGSGPEGPPRKLPGDKATQTGPDSLPDYTENGRAPAPDSPTPAEQQADISSGTEDGPDKKSAGRTIVQAFIGTQAVTMTADSEDSREGVLSVAHARATSAAEYLHPKLVSRGGMGEVYCAEERELGRMVAIKVLYTLKPEDSGRLLMEARAQAQLEHENICQVYNTGVCVRKEQGKVEERVFMAMPYIKGPTLEKARERLTLTDKVVIMEKVARAIHFAHAHGILHLDIKSSNIMLESYESMRPYVMDFGLARKLGETAVAGTSGTAQFMAPEQAEGRKKLDMRTDVYGLGATLYRLLTGKYVFDGAQRFDILYKVRTEQPRHPGEVNKDLPDDLAAIVMKCLHKDPGKRYESAKELADELKRWRTGYPVMAHVAALAAVAGRRYRLAKFNQRHRSLVVVASLLLAVAFFLAGLVVHNRLRAAARLRAERMFTSLVRQGENTMQVAYLLPAHDISRQRNTLRQLIMRVQAMLDEMGAVAQGPGAYALARCHLALDEPETALRWALKARREGYQVPEVSRTLGIIYAELFTRASQGRELKELAGFRHQPGEDGLQRLRRQALAHFDAAGAMAGANRDYYQALAAYYQHDDARAADLAEKAYKQNPALYPALRLLADIDIREGKVLIRQGDYTRAGELFKHAEERLDLALQIGSSDPGMYNAHALLWLERLRLARHADQPAPQLARGIGWADRALDIAPGNMQALRVKAMACYVYASSGLPSAFTPMQVLRKGLQAAQALTSIYPESPLQARYQAYACLLRADFERAFSRPTTASLRQAVAYFHQAMGAYNPDLELRVQLAQTYARLARQQVRQGLPPWDSLNSALEQAGRILTLSPGNRQALLLRAGLYWQKARYQLGANRENGQDVELAMADIVRVLQQDEDGPSLVLHADLLRHLALRGDKGIQRQQLMHALENYQKALVQAGDNADYLRKQADTCLLLYQVDTQAGNAAARWLETAGDLLDKAIALAPSSWRLYNARGRVFLLAAEAAGDNRRQRLAALQKARDSFLQAEHYSTNDAAHMVSRNNIGLSALLTSRSDKGNDNADLRQALEAFSAASEHLRAVDEAVWLNLADAWQEAAWHTRSAERYRTCMQGRLHAYEKVLELDDGALAAYLGLGDTLVRWGQREKGEKNQIFHAVSRYLDTLHQGWRKFPDQEDLLRVYVTLALSHARYQKRQGTAVSLDGLEAVLDTLTCTCRKTNWLIHLQQNLAALEETGR